ncbi:MAG: hypothetical protein M3R55_04040 [Acidobacteriota bacterium]|nr:hypothetical protein [Acidobacteriota bacterium]
MSRVRIRLVLLFAALCAPAAAQQAKPLEPFFPGGTYDPRVATPEAILGYAIGERHTDYAGLERWLAALRQSDRVIIRKYGESIEKRPLYLIFISSPANLARLDAVQKGMAQLANPQGLTDADARRMAADLPAVAFMNHANDGNESAAFEAAIHTSYQLAAGTDATTRLILDRLVTIVNPAHNPESHERFVNWYNAVQVGRAGTSDPASAEHHAPWGMNTNNNHYQIDLNRDAFFATQPETRAIIKAFNDWNPVVFVDHHGQTKNMFFPPPADAVNLNVTKPQLEWMNRYGNAIADAFDARGWSYYRRGRFDLFFAGFWDSWPTLNGSIGMTFETDGGGGKGLAWEREDGTILTLRDGILHHHTGTMATLKATADDKAARLEQFYQYKKSAIAEGASEPMKQIVLLPGNDLSRVQELLGTLAAQRIAAYRVPRAFRLSHAQSYRGGAAAPREVPEGAYVIPMNQPQKRLLKALLEIEPAFTDEFLQTQRDKRREAEARGERVRDGFYDTTAWSLPLIFGVDAAWSSDAPLSVNMEAGDEIGAAITGGPAPVPRYGYLFDGSTYASMQLTSELLRKGHNLVIATQPFSVQGRQFDRGAVLLRVERNGAAMPADVAAAAGLRRVDLLRLDSARVAAGPDFGEDPFVETRAPRIAVITDEPTAETSYGASWFTLEQRLGLPFTAIKIEQLLGADLTRYNVIVMPDGAAAAYQSALGEPGIARLRRWAQEGGTLVLIKGAAAFAARKGVEWTAATLKRTEQPVQMFFDEKPADKAPMREVDLPRVPGAILRVKIDPQHWLGFGGGAETAATVSSNYAFAPGRTARIAAAYPDAGSLELAGFMWPESAPALERTPYAWIERTGRGQFVLFADDPNFRATQLSTLRLFFNAVVLGPTFAR